MEEKNELNDIILNKGGGGNNSKKMLLAIAALTLLLIIVLVIMNSLKSENIEQLPSAVTPPEPSAPKEIIDDPLFEPVEVIQEGNNATAASNGTGENLDQIAQKIKQESISASPVAETVPTAVVPAKAAPTAVVPAKAAPAPKVETKPSVAPVEPVKASIAPAKTAPAKTAPAKTAPAKTAEPKKAAPAAAPAESVGKATIKKAEKPVQSQPAVQNTSVAKPKSSETSSGTYYIQVGSFAKDPNKALFDRLNSSGLKYITVPSGSATKVMVGPFKTEKDAREALGNVKRNIEAGAYVTH